MKSRKITAGITVTLECGCRVACRSSPMPGAKLGCTSGQGHGYNLIWVKAEGNGRTSYNRKFQPMGSE